MGALEGLIRSRRAEMDRRIKRSGGTIDVIEQLSFEMEMEQLRHMSLQDVRDMVDRKREADWKRGQEAVHRRRKRMESAFREPRLASAAESVEGTASDHVDPMASWWDRGNDGGATLRELLRQRRREETMEGKGESSNSAVASSIVASSTGEEPLGRKRRREASSSAFPHADIAARFEAAAAGVISEMGRGIVAGMASWMQDASLPSWAVAEEVRKTVRELQECEGEGFDPTPLLAFCALLSQ